MLFKDCTNTLIWAIIFILISPTRPLLTQGKNSTHSPQHYQCLTIPNTYRYTNNICLMKTKESHVGICMCINKLIKQWDTYCTCPGIVQSVPKNLQESHGLKRAESTCLGPPSRLVHFSYSWYLRLDMAGRFRVSHLMLTNPRAQCHLQARCAYLYVNI